MLATPLPVSCTVNWICAGGPTIAWDVTVGAVVSGSAYTGAPVSNVKAPAAIRTAALGPVPALRLLIALPPSLLRDTSEVTVSRYGSDGTSPYFIWSGVIEVPPAGSSSQGPSSRSI